MRFRSLLLSAFAAIVAGTIGVSATQISLVSGPQPAADLSSIINGLIVQINAAAGFSQFSNTVQPSPRNFNTCGTAAQLAADGNNSTPASTSVYVAEVFVPVNVVATGVATFNGSAGTDNRIVGLYSKTGTLLATSISTAAGNNDEYQRIAFSAPITVTGPGTYYIAQSYAGNTARFNTFAVGSCGAGEITTQVFANGLPASITPPTTFTTALGPIAALY